MTARRSPVRVRLDELLADGAWHDRDVLVAAVSPLVAPGVAVRRAEHQRARNSAARRRSGATSNPNAGRWPLDPAAVGARDLIVHLIGSAVDVGAYQRDTVGGAVLIRLTPRNEATP